MRTCPAVRVFLAFMPAAVVITILALIASTVPGCAAPAPGPLYAAFVDSADTFVNQTAGLRAEESLKRDPTLTEQERQTFLAEFSQFRRTIAAAKAELASNTPAAPPATGRPGG